MGMVRKGLALLRLLFVSPREFYERVSNLLEGRRQTRRFASGKGPRYSERISFQEALRELSDIYRINLGDLFSELEFADVQKWVTQKTRELQSDPASPFPVIWGADTSLMRLAYALTKILEPKLVLETGVAYGVTTETILTALAGNGDGRLYSVDLAPLRDNPSESAIGIMVRPPHRSRWKFNSGSSRDVLPHLLAEGLAPVGLFIHDSANLYSLQSYELNLMWDHLTPNGVMLVNNIGRSAAFQEFVDARSDSRAFVIEQVDKAGALTGVILRTGEGRNA